MIDFKGHRVEKSVIVTCVRWYVAYPLSYRNLEEMMAESRKNIHRAVNRGESYHKLRRAISHANFGKLRFKTEYEQEIWNECARLISNCVIFYNATILSRLCDWVRR